MSVPLTSDFVRLTLRDLLQATDDCVRVEAEASRTLTEKTADAERAYERQRSEIQKAWDAAKSAETATHQEQLQQSLAACEADEAAIEKEFASTSAEIVLQYERDEATTTKEYQESSWTLEAIYDAQKKQAREKLDAARRTFADQRATVQTIRDTVNDRIREWKQIPKAAPFVEAPKTDPATAIQEAASRVASAKQQAVRLNKLIAPKLLVGDRLLFIGIGMWLVFMPALAAFAGWVLLREIGFVIFVALVGGTALALGASFLTKLLLAVRARRAVHSICEPLHKALAEAEAICQQGEAAEEIACLETIAAGKQKYKGDRRAAEKHHRERLAAALERRDQSTRDAGAARTTNQKQLAERRLRETTKLIGEHQARLASLENRFGGQLTRATDEFHRLRDRVRDQFDDKFAKLSSSWQQEFGEAKERLESIRAQDRELFPDWSGPAWSAWKPPVAVPPSLRFGALTATLPGRPQDARLEAPPPRVTLPALLPFPHQCSTLLHATGAGRTAAAQALLAMAMRFLTALPAGKARLTIVDPVGLGENFAALMHLADYDPQLVGARIWTEPPQIEKRLADMTAHMENVIQKYLRSQYASIEEYNVQAGEVAEPYRVLVVANFPANFTSEAARRLERVAASGASCGVYTLVSIDSSLPLPQGYDPADLERASLNLRWKNERFVWQDVDFEKWPLAIDPPPAQEVLTKTLDRIGSASKDANRVEVDFEFIAPKPAERWRGDSRAGIDVPLGRAGATKRQHLQLGKGTAQHVIVAGKTGSGKSTLLHALITNLALTYGPEEVELYLIDFKKGVEFKTYASQRLPHARVIAVESEREFGLSVLQRLDSELKRRGDLYRNAGVQDVKGYRDLSVVRGPSSVDKPDSAATDNGQRTTDNLPRILLIVDEFQEFFVEDDRVAQEAALLLDRLVRQGRAFGLHVLLGSQTLGGAYSLARSTIDQMAVRIALQCSEADAGLILSKDNNAARLLSRPGEAIYNDANGLIEGNDIFQVVWLPDDRREQYLIAVRQAAEERGFRPPAPMVVFEGNVPSDLTADDWLATKLAAPTPTLPPRELVCRLGDAMAIKAPTAAVFRRQSASNLLILGQQADSARALILAAMIEAVVQQPPAGPDDPPRVVLLDGTPADDPHAGHFAKVFADFPGIRVFGGRETADALKLVSEEYERRAADPAVLAPALVLFVYGIHRLKDLRKPEDDFGFRKSEGEPSPAQRFATLVREGPAVGVHIVAWCDTLVNVQRAFERAALREFEMKVLFQMGANDSSTLIDSPHASRLGVNRALFAHEELTAPEKFRPYSLPTDEWIAGLKQRLLERQPTGAGAPSIG